jgi:ABC-type transporter Mla subunit MlaD
MGGTGVLETMARADLDALVDELRREYRPGALDALAARDPEWRGAVDRAEQQVGSLYEALREADQTLAQWRQAVGHLRRLWVKVGDTPAGDSAALSDVA